MQPRRDETQFPDIPTPRLALAVSAAVAFVLASVTWTRFGASFGDTDDAMRLVMVRELVAGQTSWFHAAVARADPPHGLVMHWSRLVDAGLAGLDRLFMLFLPPPRAEVAMRFVWPLLWLAPAIWATLAMARRLGGAGAAFVAAIMLMVNLLIYGQWSPGRIDHHDIQIGLSLVAVAAALRGGTAGGLAAGAVTGLAMAVGLEALAFEALVGAAFALRFAVDPRGQSGPARAYGLALTVSVSLLHLAQTPPGLWGASVCDAFGANLWAAVATAGLGLAAVVQATAARSLALRLAALALVGALAGGAYVTMAPACLGGPLGGIDPRIRPIWLDYISEMLPLLRGFPRDATDAAVNTLGLGGLGLAAWLWRGRRKEHRDIAWLLVGACLAVGLAAALDARRMASYPVWFAIPLIAPAIHELAVRFFRRPLAPAALAAVLLAPAVWISTTEALERRLPKPPAKAGPVVDSRCFQHRAYAALAKLPPGLVLSEPDLGPYVLAETQHSVVSAPYHRMSGGVLKAHLALSAAPGEDERAVRSARAVYVLNCPTHANRLNHTRMPRSSLQARLDKKIVPDWLQPLSPPTAWLQVYRVRPPATRTAPQSTSSRVR